MPYPHQLCTRLSPTATLSVPQFRPPLFQGTRTIINMPSPHQLCTRLSPTATLSVPQFRPPLFQGTRTIITILNKTKLQRSHVMFMSVVDKCPPSGVWSCGISGAVNYSSDDEPSTLQPSSTVAIIITSRFVCAPRLITPNVRLVVWRAESVKTCFMNGWREGAESVMSQQWQAASATRSARSPLSWPNTAG